MVEFVVPFVFVISIECVFRLCMNLFTVSYCIWYCQQWNCSDFTQIKRLFLCSFVECKTVCFRRCWCCAPFDSDCAVGFCALQVWEVGKQYRSFCPLIYENVWWFVCHVFDSTVLIMSSLQIFGMVWLGERVILSSQGGCPRVHTCPLYVSASSICVGVHVCVCLVPKAEWCPCWFCSSSSLSCSTQRVCLLRRLAGFSSVPPQRPSLLWGVKNFHLCISLDKKAQSPFESSGDTGRHCGHASLALISQILKPVCGEQDLRG